MNWLTRPRGDDPRNPSILDWITLPFGIALILGFIWVVGVWPRRHF